MKRYLSILVLFITVITMEAQNKVLIAYFSRTGENYAVGTITKGNTARVAEEIQKLTNGQLFEIKSDRKYSDNYKTCCDQAKEDLNKNARPKLLADVKDMSQYDTIYLGYPIWWGTMPMPVLSFIEAHGGLKGKTIIPFCTHEGSSFGSSLSDLKKACPQATIKSGLSIQGKNTKNCAKTVENFIKK